MSVESETSSVSYTGNNSTVVAYVIPFLFYKQEHIEAVVIDEDGEETALALTTDFTVTGEGDEDGGTLLTVEAYDNTNTITIRRSAALTQPFVFEEGQRLPMKTLEKALDYGVMHSQRVLREAQEAAAIADDALVASAAAQAAVEAVEDSVTAAEASATQAANSADSAADSAAAAEAAQAAAEEAADIDAGDIVAALGYTPANGSTDTLDRFYRYADNTNFVSGVTTPESGAAWVFNTTGPVFTAASATDLLTLTDHGFASGTPVKVASAGGTLPSPLVSGTTYFARDITANTFKLALTSGGAAIDLLSDSSGLVTVGAVPNVTGGILRAVGKSLLYVGNVAATNVRTLSIEMDYSAVNTAGAGVLGNAVTIALGSTQLINGTTNNIAIPVGMRHISLNESGMIIGYSATGTASFTDIPCVNATAVGGRYLWFDDPTSAAVAYKKRFTVTVSFVGSEIRVSGPGKTLIFDASAIPLVEGRYYWVEYAGDDSSTYYNYPRIYRISVNSEEFENRPGNSVQAFSRQLSDLASLRPKLYGINGAEVGNSPTGWAPTLVVGGASLSSDLLTGGGIHNEGRYSMSMPRYNGGIGYGTAVLPCTYLKNDAAITSDAGGVEASEWGKYFAVGLTVGDSEEIVWKGLLAANGNNKRLRVRIGGATFPAGFDSGVLTSNNVAFQLTLSRVALTGDSYRLFWKFELSGASPTFATYSAGGGLTSLVDYYLMLTGDTAGDVTIYSANAMLRQGPSN